MCIRKCKIFVQNLTRNTNRRLKIWIRVSMNECEVIRISRKDIFTEEDKLIFLGGQLRKQNVCADGSRTNHYNTNMYVFMHLSSIRHRLLAYRLSVQWLKVQKRSQISSARGLGFANTCHLLKRHPQGQAQSSAWGQKQHPQGQAQSSTWGQK